MADAAAGTVSSGQGASVQSLERALDILELLSRSESELGVTEIGPAVGLPNGTAHRLLNTLTLRGYALRNPQTRKYSLGPKALLLSSAGQEHLGPLAKPFLEELMQVSWESANVAGLNRNTMVYLEQVPAPRTVRMFTEPGNRFPPHSTGTGKALLAYQPEEVIDSIIQQNGLPSFTSYTITSAKELKSELESIREQGYATDSEETEEGVCCLAAPVFGPDGQILAAISVSGPASRLDESRIGELIPHITRIAGNFSRSLSVPD